MRASFFTWLRHFLDIERRGLSICSSVTAGIAGHRIEKLPGVNRFCLHPARSCAIFFHRAYFARYYALAGYFATDEGILLPIRPCHAR